MKKHIAILTAVASLASVSAFGQGAVDAFTLSQRQLRGTARYMSMGGAFGALGGDLSTLNQNPAGIGVYRSSDIGATLDIDFQRTSLTNTGDNNPANLKQTRAACNNFGYVGAVSTGSSLMPYFQWGATYNRINSFERQYRGYFPQLNTSWTNYVAQLSGGYTDKSLLGTDSYDPFFDRKVPWLSALAYNTMLINPSPYYTNDNPSYDGLWGNGTYGDAQIDVREKGYIDEYSINFGGNFSNMVYWGLGFGITDLSFTRLSYYDEQLGNAYVLNADESGVSPGEAAWGIENWQSVSGTGFNVKFGLIFKPVNEFRLGLAVHSPTWYNLDFSQNAWIDYKLGQKESDGYYTWDSAIDKNDFATTTEGYWSSKLKTPWRLMASAATVLGGRFILSADYVYEAYPDMEFSDGFGKFDDVKADIKQYYRPSNELRLGAEFRVTPNFSVRAGYDYKSSGARQEARDGFDYVYTAGTQTAYEFDNDSQNITCGVGYHSGGFYVDAAYVHSNQKSEWSAFSSFPRADNGNAAYDLVSNPDVAPRGTITSNNNHLVLTVGMKF